MGFRPSAIAGCALGALTCFAGGARGADNRPPAAVHELKIGRQPLDSALQQLAKQCGLQIIFFSSVTEGFAAPEISGPHTLDSAMDELLSGSGLSFRVINAQTIEVRPRRMLGVTNHPVTLRSPAKASVPEPDPVEEVVVIGLAEQLVATRIATPLMEIPQTISIVTREQMRVQNDVDLADVLEHVPGITALRSSSLDQQFHSRAYSITSYHIDGGAAVNPDTDQGPAFRHSPDLSEFDHVEILRGADGLFGGNAKPGGTVSLVRKRPQHHFALDVNAAAGSWNESRIEVDITGPLARDGDLRGRADVVHAQEGYFFDVEQHERKKIFAVVEYDLTPRGTLTTGGSYQWDDSSVLWGGVPLSQIGHDTRLPRDTTLAFDWNFDRGTMSELYLQYRHDLGDDWALKFNSAAWRGKYEYAAGEFSEPAGALTGRLPAPDASFSTEPIELAQTTADITLTGAFDWRGLRQDFTLGGDFTRVTIDGSEALYFDAGPPLDDILEFDPANYPDPRLAEGDRAVTRGMQSVDHYGVFASTRLHFGDDWSLTTGARISGNTTDTRLELDFGPPFPQIEWITAYRLDPVVTPYAGLMHAINDNYSWYASYAEIYRGSGVRKERRSGDGLSHVRGINVETGIKAAWRGGSLNGSLVFYRIEERNIAVPDGSIVINEPDDARCCWLSRFTRSKGVDAELNGELAPGWMIGIGYTYNTNKIFSGEPLSSITPRHLLKMWTNARLPGRFNRWEVGGGLHAQSRAANRQTLCIGTDADCRPFEAVQRSYAVLDLRAAVDLTDTWQVAFKVNNALDKIYYESIGTGNFHAWYGEPRNWSLRIDGRF